MPTLRAVLCAAALALVGASCDSATAPRDDVVVVLRVDSAATPVITDTPNGPQIVCAVALSAIASGRGSAEWQNGAAYWYTGHQRTTPVDSTAIASSDIAATFGGDEDIAAGETRHATWYFVSQAPFELSVGFGYETPEGTTATARARYRCGPDPASAVPPVITRVTPSSPGGRLQPGDTVSVSYQETSSSGVWMTIVATSGAFTSRRTAGEHLATNVDRTLKFVVPSNVTPGIPLTITVQAYDAALQTRATSLDTQLVFASQP